MTINNLIKILCASCFLSNSLSAYSAWVGPQEVLNGSWGSGPTEFYVDWGDTPAYSVLPVLYDISSNDALVIADKRNGRIKIYGSDGNSVRNITPPVTRPSKWTMQPKFVGENVVIPLDHYYFFSSTGDLIAQPDGPGKVYYDGEYNMKLYVAEREPNKRWLIYSAGGSLLETVTVKPLELGRIDEALFIYKNEKLNRIKVSFPGQQWMIAGKGGSCGEYNYFVNSTGFLHCISQENAVRYSACGKEIATLEVPEETAVMLSPSPSGSGIEPNWQITESFGNFLMADNGDLYASRYTQTSYSVVRWTWQNSPNDLIGEPDAPTEIISTVAGTEVTLKWTSSLQDPGCVTEYDITRATVESGSYVSVGKALAGAQEYKDNTVQTGTTYYYKIYSVSAIGNSVVAKAVSVSVN